MKNSLLEDNFIVTQISTMSSTSKMHVHSSSANTLIKYCNKQCLKEKSYVFKSSISKKLMQESDNFSYSAIRSNHVI